TRLPLGGSGETPRAVGFGGRHSAGGQDFDRASPTPQALVQQTTKAGKENSHTSSRRKPTGFSRGRSRAPVEKRNHGLETQIDSRILGRSEPAFGKVDAGVDGERPIGKGWPMRINARLREGTPSGAPAS